MLKLKLQYIGHLMQRADSLENTLMLGQIEGRREGGDRGWDGWTASPTHHMSVSELRELAMDRKACRAAVHGVAESGMTEWLNNNNNYVPGTILGANDVIEAAESVSRGG